MSKKSNKRHTAIPPVTATPAQAEAAKVVAKAKKKAAALEGATATVVVETAPTQTIAPAIVATSPVTTAVKAPAVTAPVAAAVKVAETAPVCQELLAALHGSDADAARDAAAALGTRGNIQAVDPLLEVLNNRDGFFHTVVRAAAASSLAQLGDVRAVDSLIDATHDSMAETSAEAVRALATLGDARAIAPLIDVLRNSNGYFQPIVRRAAVLALAKLGGEQATVELRAVAGDTWEDAVIRQEAQQAIGHSTCTH